MEKLNLNIENITEKLAVDLLTYECDLRKSDEMQDYYSFLENSKGGKQEIVENFVQFKTIRDFGYVPDWESLRNYRKISEKFIDSEKVRNSAFYLKYNIIEPSTVKVGTHAQNVSLLTLDKIPCKLFDFIKSPKPLVILAGSIS